MSEADQAGAISGEPAAMPMPLSAPPPTDTAPATTLQAPPPTLPRLHRMVTAVPTTPADKAANDALSTSSPATGPSAVKVAEAAKGAEAAVAAGHQTGSLLERFVSDEMWEQNPVLRRFAPYLHQVERAMMVFGSSALAWAVGRSGWSFAWVLLVCLSMVPAWDRSLKVGFQRMKALARYEVLHSRLETDWESMEWWNYFFQKFWYQLEPDISKAVVQAVNLQLEQIKVPMVSALVLSEFTLGSQAPVIRAAKAFPRVFGDDRAQLMFHVTFTPLEEEDMIAERVRQSKNKLRVDAQKDDYGHFSKDLENSKITLTAYLNMGTKVGVPIELKNLAMEGQFIIRFKFMSAMPYVSDVQVWFPDEFGPPSVDFQLQPLKSVDVLNVPGLNSIIDSAIRDGVKGALQYPGIKQDLSAMAAPPAESGEWAAGVLRFTVISAKDLPNMDTFSGASDPYAKALMGLTGAERELARTRVIKDTPTPLWNETFFALIPNSVLSADGISTGADNVRFEVMDWNDKTGHTFIGITKKMRIAEFIRSGDQGSLPEDRKKEIHASWGAPDKLSPVWAQLTKREDVRDLKGQLQLDVTWGVAGDLDQTNADVKSGIVRVTIHQASELNVYGSIANFTPYILFHIGGKEVFKTVRKRSTQNPAYGQTFEYYFNDITDAEIAADVRHLDPLREDPSIGTLTVKIADAIARKQGDDWFTLFNTPSGRLRLDFKFRPVRWPESVTGSTVVDTVLARQGTRLELDTTDPTQAAAGGVPVKPSTQPPVPEVIDQATLEELGFKWIPATGGTVPPLAVEGDPAQTKPSEKQYVSRVSLGGGVFAGKTISVFRGTNYALNGEEKVIKDYETLCASTPEALRRARWVRIKSSAELAQCVGLVSGGLRDATGNQLIVARKHYRNGYHVGNTGKNLPGIAFPWGGKERVEAADFEVLCVE